MQRLSSPVSEMDDHYTVVVIGSGYGGGIAASRLARAGQDVCLLERGEEMHPGEYPETEEEGLEEMQFDTPDGHLGSRTGLYDFTVDEGQNVLVGCGLGGTSLINANVALRATPEVWEDERWPEELRGGDRLIEEGYERAEAMLEPTPYPEDEPDLAKLDALEASADALGDGDEFYRPPINVTFEDGENAAGVRQRACVGCGDCVSGCNYWAKNTVLMNYLPDAHRHGAEIFTRCEVRWLEREGDRWVVRFRTLEQGREAFDAPEQFVAADVVVVAAGTLGSTEILLRSRERGLALSDRLGERFSGNGDVLAFGYDCDRPIHGVGWGRSRPEDHPQVGPCITGIIDRRDVDPFDRRFVVEEGVIPGALGPTLPAALGGLSDLLGREPEGEDESLIDRLRDAGREAESLVRGPYHGAVDRTQTYLVMSHDGALGRIRLEDDRVRVDWPEVGREPVFRRVNDYLDRATEPLGGTFLKNPIWSDLLGDSVISVHPLGGCAMGDDAGSGVVDHRGRVFRGDRGEEVHDGLYVTDGSVVPLSLAVNPLLTISAISERAMALLAEERGWAIDYASDPPTPAPDPEAGSDAPGLRFTETMKGWFSTGVTDEDWEAARERAEAADSPMRFTLTISTDDLDALIDEPEHRARLSGTVSCAALSAEPMDAHDGVFNLFVKDPEGVNVRKMIYRMRLATAEGEDYFFHGFKEITDAGLEEAWPQTTTLYVTVHEGPDDDGPVVGRGILRIEPEDFARQLTTMKVTGGQGPLDRLEGEARFGKFFAGVLFEHYGGVFVGESYFDPEAPPRKRRPLRVNAPEFHPFTTDDGVELLLTRYRGGEKGPVMLVHGAGVSSEIFSTDLIRTNLLEYLYAHGYDVWLFDFRVSIALAAAEHLSNGDQVARYDHPEAVARVQEVTGADTIQAVVHCYGSNTFFMSLLRGLEGVRSVVCSQVATDLVCPELTRFKTGVHMPGFLEKLGVDSLTAYVDADSGWRAKLLDRLLELEPVPEDQECHNPVCHRVTFLYALLYQHQQLDQRLHDNLHELFGVGNIAMFEHLAEMVRREVVVSHEGEDVYMPHFSERLELPIRFIQGAENRCYLPESTERTYDRLREVHGEELYDRHLIPGYGHIDSIFGKDAVDDVYPLILEHLERTA